MAKVLIVDDSIYMRKSIKTILEGNGIIVADEAENGILAVQKYKECQPDLVTMDITMPEMEGTEALRLIRQFDSKAKVIMITAMGQEYLVKEAILNGAKSFIVKPFNKEELLEAIHKVIAL